MRRSLTAAVAAGAVALAGVLIGAGALAALTSAVQAATASPSGAIAPIAAGSSVAVIVMENHEYGEVIGSPAAPFINGLVKRSALATDMHAATHPSLPNYLALTSASTFGISSDCTSCTVGATSIVDQLEAARISWKAYMEDIPRPCFTGAGAADYAKKHDPFVYYTRVVHDARWCRNVVPLTELATDQHRRELPRFIWITPNLCHDMHDCSLSTADHFLARLLPPLLARLGHNGLLFLTWDEGTSDDGCCRLAAGGHIATIVAGPGARRHARFATPVDHYSLLQAIEDLFEVRRLGGAACACTPSLSPLLVAK